MVVVIACIQIFFGVVLAVLWFSFSAVATVAALVSLKPDRRWFGPDRPITPGRLFVVIVSTWVVGWAIAAIGYTCAALVLAPVPSVGYALGVLASAAVGVAPFLLVFVLTSAIQLSRYSRRLAR